MSEQCLTNHPALPVKHTADALFKFPRSPCMLRYVRVCLSVCVLVCVCVGEAGRGAEGTAPFIVVLGVTLRGGNSPGC